MPMPEMEDREEQHRIKLKFVPDQARPAVVEDSTRDEAILDLFTNGGLSLIPSDQSDNLGVP